MVIAYEKSSPLVEWVIFGWVVAVVTAAWASANHRPSVVIECQSYGNATERATKWVDGACYVQHRGEWWRLDQLRAPVGT